MATTRRSTEEKLIQFQIRRLAIAASDFGRAHAFLTEALGQKQQFADPPNYAEFDVQIGVALVADHDLPQAGVSSLMIKVDSVADAVGALVAAGAVVLSTPATGGHEVRASVSIPGSSLSLVLYGAS